MRISKYHQDTGDCERSCIHERRKYCARYSYNTTCSREPGEGEAGFFFVPSDVRKRTLILTLLFASIAIYGNSQMQQNTVSLIGLKKPLYLSSKPLSNEPSVSQLAKDNTTPDWRNLSQVAPNGAARHLPFFCERERILDKKFTVPIRFRLGSLQQTDWLEHKPLAIRPE